MHNYLENVRELNRGRACLGMGTTGDSYNIEKYKIFPLLFIILFMGVPKLR